MSRPAHRWHLLAALIGAGLAALAVLLVASVVR